jgi:hypothetical protein
MSVRKINKRFEGILLMSDQARITLCKGATASELKGAWAHYSHGRGGKSPQCVNSHTKYCSSNMFLIFAILPKVGKIITHMCQSCCNHFEDNSEIKVNAGSTAFLIIQAEREPVVEPSMKTAVVRGPSKLDRVRPTSRFHMFICDPSARRFIQKLNFKMISITQSLEGVFSYETKKEFDPLERSFMTERQRGWL